MSKRNPNNDPALYARRWRAKWAGLPSTARAGHVARTAYSMLHLYTIEQLGLTDDEQKALSAEIERRDEQRRAAEYAVSPEGRRQRIIEMLRPSEYRVLNPPSLINRIHSRWGLKFNKCRALGCGYTQPRSARRMVYSAEVTEEFWSAWHADKAAINLAGYQPRRQGCYGLWIVELSVPFAQDVAGYGHDPNYPNWTVLLAHPNDPPDPDDDDGLELVE